MSLRKSGHHQCAGETGDGKQEEEAGETEQTDCLQSQGAEQMELWRTGTERREKRV